MALKTLPQGLIDAISDVPKVDENKFIYESVYPYLQGVFGPPRGIGPNEESLKHPLDLLAEFNTRVKHDLSTETAYPYMGTGARNKLLSRSLVPNRLQNDIAEIARREWWNPLINEDSWAFEEVPPGRSRDIIDAVEKRIEAQYPKSVKNHSFFDIYSLPRNKQVEIYGSRNGVGNLYEPFLADRFWMEGYKNKPLIKGEQNAVNQEAVDWFNAGKPKDGFIREQPTVRWSPNSDTGVAQRMANVLPRIEAKAPSFMESLAQIGSKIKGKNGKRALLAMLAAAGYGMKDVVADGLLDGALENANEGRD